VVVLPLAPTLLVLPEELDPEVLEPEAPVLPEELLPPSAATLELPVVLLALSVGLPPQAVMSRQADRQAATAAARSSEG